MISGAASGGCFPLRSGRWRCRPRWSGWGSGAGWRWRGPRWRRPRWRRLGRSGLRLCSLRRRCAWRGTSVGHSRRSRERSLAAGGSGGSSNRSSSSSSTVSSSGFIPTGTERDWTRSRALARISSVLVRGWAMRGAALERANRALERQPLRLQHVRRSALAVADDGGEYDCAVDLPTPASPRGSGSGIEDAAQIGRHAGIDHAAGEGLALQTDKIARGIRFQLHDVDIARRQHEPRIRVLAQRHEHVLERHLGVALGARVLPRPRQRGIRARSDITTRLRSSAFIAFFSRPCKFAARGINGSAP